MKMKREFSHGSERGIKLVEALAIYTTDPKELVALAGKIWPQLDVYRGHTHLRLMPTGKSALDSIYVDLEGA